MGKNRQRQRENKKKGKIMEGGLSAKTNGHTDLTPYSAITGNILISKSILTSLDKKVYGSYNG